MEIDEIRFPEFNQWKEISNSSYVLLQLFDAVWRSWINTVNTISHLVM